MKNYWTPKDIELLKEKYNEVSNDELLKLFPDRSPQGIYKKAYKLGIRKSPEMTHINRGNARRGEKCPSWKGGKRITAKGYITIKRPEHHRADRRGYVMEHIVVFEEATGIKVPPNCAVHHIDGNKANNNINNLCLMTHGAHTAYHNRKRRS
jgi:hypothetical protein